MDQQFDVAPLFALSRSALIEGVSFESCDPIDDLTATCDGGHALRLQVKRKLALSAKDDSDFVGVIDQFVAQYLAGCNENDTFGLVTSSEASSKVRIVLKRLLDQLRLSDSAFVHGGLNRTEAEVVDTYEQVVRGRFFTRAGVKCSDEQLRSFSRHVAVAQLDAGQGQPYESTALVMLASFCVGDPALIWSLLGRWCLHWASHRTVVDRAGIHERLSQYRRQSNVVESTRTEDVGVQIRDALADDRLVPSGREVVLVDWEEPGPGLTIMEFRRFDPACQPRLEFQSEHVLWGDHERRRSRVHARAATKAGMERLLEECEALDGVSEVTILESNLEDDPDQSACAIAHAEVCSGLIRSRSGFERCVHCGKPISAVENTLVELDDLETAHGVGLVHDECRRTVDRVLGIVQFPGLVGREYLTKFDAVGWCRRRPAGQLLFNELDASREIAGNTVARIYWNPKNAAARGKAFCVEIQLSDGGLRHLTSRGRLDRFDRPTAEVKSQEFNAHLSRAHSEGDPPCYTTGSWRFGLHSQLVGLADDDEEIFECLSSRVVRYSEHIGRQYPAAGDFYAPLCFLADPDTDVPLSVNGGQVLLSDPLQLSRFLKNWDQAGHAPESYEVGIIYDDEEFDAWVADALDHSRLVVVDPLLDRAGSMVKGFVVQHIPEP